MRIHNDCNELCITNDKIKEATPVPVDTYYIVEPTAVIATSYCGSTYSYFGIVNVCEREDGMLMF